MSAKASPLPIIQNCWVVPDIAAAAKPWIALGVGPFFLFDVDVPDALYRGKRVPLSFSVGLAQAGPLQIEFVCQHSPGPSAYRDTVPAGKSGFHHVCRALGGYDETVALLRKQGITLATEAVFNGSRFCYADTRETLGCMLELLDESAAGTYLVETVRNAAIGWDGSDPLRRLPAP